MVSKDKKYTLKDGTEFKIYEIYKDKVHGAYRKGNEWIIQAVPMNGLIEVSPYAHIKIDDKVLVWDSENQKKQKRHFSGINEHGEPTTWSNGQTSFSTDGDINPVTWRHCEKFND